MIHAVLAFLLIFAIIIDLFLCYCMIRDDADNAVDKTIDNPVNENVEPERHSVLAGIMRDKMKTDNDKKND